jgi:hypothetical protein
VSPPPALPSKRAGEGASDERRILSGRVSCHDVDDLEALIGLALDSCLRRRGSYLIAQEREDCISYVFSSAGAKLGLDSLQSGDAFIARLAARRGGPIPEPAAEGRDRAA